MLLAEAAVHHWSGDRAGAEARLAQAFDTATGQGAEGVLEGLRRTAADLGLA